MRRILTVVLCLVWAADARAQRVIYDAERDATAQETAATAKELTSGALFAAMLKNVDAQAKLEVDTVTAFVQERMRARLNAFEVWQDPKAVPVQLPKPGEKFSPQAAAFCRRSVECQLATLRLEHREALAAPVITEAELNARLTAIKTRSAALQAELKALQQASKSADPFVVRAFEALEDPGGDILKYAERIAGLATNPATAQGVANALAAIEEGLDQILGLYKAIASIWRGQQAVSADPASLRPPPQQIELQLLAVEQAHLKSIARINARKELEVGVALSAVETAMLRVGIVLKQDSKIFGQSPRPIEGTLREAAASHNRQALREQWEALHDTASAIAQLDGANSLATLRLSDEARRYSIRRSTVNISTYDLTIQAAAQRLALYWKGGIKPTELAQFVYYVTNSIALPVIAIKE